MYKITRCYDGSAAYRRAQVLDRTCLPHDTPHLGDGEWDTWFLLSDGTTPVGYVAVEQWQAPLQGVVVVHRIGVRDRFRSRGLARRLLRTVEAWARRHSQFELITYVERWNVSSLNAFLKAGWRVYWPAEEWGSKQAVYLYKALREGGPVAGRRRKKKKTAKSQRRTSRR